MDFSFSSTPLIDHSFQPRTYSLRRILFGLVAVQCIAFFLYLFAGRTLLPSAMFDTMTAPFYAHFHPPQAENTAIFDALTQTYCYKTETQRGLRHGTLAHWNPRIFNGYPQYAETMGNNFDPLNLLLLWMDPSQTILWQTILELLIAGIGMAYLLRFLGIEEGINAIFSMSYMLNSLFIANAEHRWIVA